VLAYAPVSRLPIPVAMALTFGASLLLAFGTTRLIEIPVLRWRDRHSSANANAPRPELAPELVTQAP